jgi:hypothetical protein
MLDPLRSRKSSLSCVDCAIFGFGGTNSDFTLTAVEDVARIIG